MMDFMALAHECAPQVHPVTMAAVVGVESSFNPFAIGVVGGKLDRQPQNKAEAVATAKALEKGGWNFSVGASQVNRYNLAKYNLSYETAFDPCPNFRAGANILKDCYDRALVQFGNEQQALQASFSCYYSGNFSTGFKPDFKGQPSYVMKVLASAGAGITGAIPVTAQPGAKKIAGKPNKAATANIDAIESASVPKVADDVPVLLQAVQAKPKKARNVPAKYDGFTSTDDQKQSNPYDGFDAGSAE